MSDGLAAMRAAHRNNWQSVVAQIRDGLSEVARDDFRGAGVLPMRRRRLVATYRHAACLGGACEALGLEQSARMLKELTDIMGDVLWRDPAYPRLLWLLGTLAGKSLKEQDAIPLIDPDARKAISGLTGKIQNICFSKVVREVGKVHDSTHVDHPAPTEGGIGAIARAYESFCETTRDGARAAYVSDAPIEEVYTSAISEFERSLITVLLGPSAADTTSEDEGGLF